jgi:hypothetical protein
MPETKMDNKTKITIALLVVFIYATFNAIRLYFMTAKTYVCSYICPQKIIAKAT